VAPTRSWIVDHAEFEGDSIDRDRGYPDLEVEVHPMGILTERPTFQLLVRIEGKVTVLTWETTKELVSWLADKTRA